MVSSIAITLATKSDVSPSLEILLDSYLGEEYFTRETAEPILRDAAEKKELFVAKGGGGDVVGFYRLTAGGTFNCIPNPEMSGENSG